MKPRPTDRLRRFAGSVKSRLHRGFTQHHSTERVAGSFSLGLFVSMLPTVGVGPSAMLGLSTVVDRLNRLALVAAVAVCNPLVKPAIYAASLGLGFLVLGPVDGVALAEVSLSVAPDVLVRLLVGNVLLALVVAVPGYAVAFRTVDRYRRRSVRPRL